MSQPKLTVFYIGRWGVLDVDGDGSFYAWNPEFEMDSWIDLRTDTNTKVIPTIGATMCCLIGVTENPIRPSEGWIQLGSSITSPVSISPRIFENDLEYPTFSLTGTTLGDLFFELLIEDANRLSDRKPLSPNRNLVFTVKMDETRLFNKSIIDEPDSWEVVRKRIEIDYDKLRTESLKNNDELYLKWLGLQASKYRVDYRIFLGTNPDEGTVSPATIHSDDFDCADQAALGCDLTWTEIAGDHDIDTNEARNTANQFSLSRAEHDTSDDDVKVTTNTGTFTGTIATSGVTIRHDNSVETYYACRYRPRSGTNTWIYETTASSAAILTSQETSPTPATGFNAVICEINGSAIDFTLAGTLELSTSDSSITGNTRGGIIDSGNGGDRIRWSEWQIEDLAAGAARRRFIN